MKRYDEAWIEKKMEETPLCYECGDEWIDKWTEKLYEVKASSGRSYKICGRCLDKMTVNELFFEEDEIDGGMVMIYEVDVASKYHE